MAKRYCARVQALFTEDEYALLKQQAEQEGKSISCLVRDAVVKQIVEQRERERKLAIVEWMAKGDAPVCDWPEMERQIEEARYAGEPPFEDA